MRGAIHEFEVLAPGETIRSAEGKAKRVGKPTVVRGRISSPSQRDIDRGTATSQTITAVGTIAQSELLRSGLTFADNGKGYQVKAENIGFPWDGTYEVIEIRASTKQLRLILTRAA